MTTNRRHARAASALDVQLAALRDVVRLARGRLDDELVDRAEGAVRQAGARLGLGMDATVVALAGPTGAGKSTLFNALAGTELATPGHLRPTTSTATAAVWGDVGNDLLDWLDVPIRHRLEGEPRGLVLLDLPDFDSVRRAHRTEAERVIGVADLTAWIVDPQKYADGVLHDRYLRPHAGRGDAMLVVLNHADRLEDDARRACVTDIRRLLLDDGLPDVPVIAASALTGFGLDELRAELRRRVDAREAATRRLAADAVAAADALAGCCAGTGGGEVRASDRAALVAAFGAAAGAPAVVHALARAHRRRGALATGWPWVRWVRRFRPDPLRRLRIGGGGSQERSSLAAPTRAHVAQVDAAIRTLAARVAAGLAEPWPGLVRAAALREEGRLADRLDVAVSGAELPVRPPHWWRLANVLQWALLAASVAGSLWLVALAGLAYLRLGEVVPTPEVDGIPIPTALLIGGAVLGLVLAVLAGAITRLGARRRARVTQRILATRVGEVADTDVLEPLQTELAARRDLCALITAAQGSGSGVRAILPRAVQGRSNMRG